MVREGAAAGVEEVTRPERELLCSLKVEWSVLEEEGCSFMEDDLPSVIVPELFVALRRLNGE